MEQEDILECFEKLGRNNLKWENISSNPLIEEATIQNRWFTNDFIRIAVSNIEYMLASDKIRSWASKYSFTNKPKNIGIVAAGNIPLVAFHDILCILISGNIATVKLSSKDKSLYKLVLGEISIINKDIAKRVILTDGVLKDIDAIIATGSNNSARYFDYYFSKYPNIIRKNRNSIAILSGKETDDELQNLSDDIFMFFGMGCRNISQIVIPENYDITKIIPQFGKWEHLLENTKYCNNLTYHKTILLMNSERFFESNLVLLKESSLLSSPIGIIHFIHYKNEGDITNYIAENRDDIQCIVSNKKWNEITYPFGKAQAPEIDDYADGIDTMKFLNNLN